MRLLRLHDMIKRNYEQGLYSPSYIYEPEAQNYLTDFELGKQRACDDYRNGERFRFYPLPLFKFVNLMMGKRMDEVVNFIRGYNSEKQRLQKNG